MQRGKPYILRGDSNKSLVTTCIHKIGVKIKLRKPS
jgi:hypothetical protein